MHTIDLTQGLCDNEQYKAWRFPGGELHVVLKEVSSKIIKIVTNLSCSDDLVLLLLLNDIIKSNKYKAHLFVTYMSYQQADRRFDDMECFSLKIIANIINSCNFESVKVFDPHSDVTPALINNCIVKSNYDFIWEVMLDLITDLEISMHDIIILSPDAGAYKKIFKLCGELNFKGEIVTCSKSRNHLTGEKTIIVPKFDSTKPVLIIDDICLAGGTFLGIANQIQNPCYLAVSHGIFNNGIDHLLEKFDKIFTTNSRCQLKDDNLIIYEL